MKVLPATKVEIAILHRVPLDLRVIADYSIYVNFVDATLTVPKGYTCRQLVVPAGLRAIFMAAIIGCCFSPWFLIPAALLLGMLTLDRINGWIPALLLFHKIVAEGGIVRNHQFRPLSFLEALRVLHRIGYACGLPWYSRWLLVGEKFFFSCGPWHINRYKQRRHARQADIACVDCAHYGHGCQIKHMEVHPTHCPRKIPCPADKL